MKKSPDELELERWADRRLRVLPVPRAPDTLLPRVMAAVRALAAKPWYTRTWFTWPLAGQLLSAGIVLSIVIGVWLVSPLLQTTVDSVMSRATQEILRPFAGVIDRADRWMMAARLVWRLSQPIAAVLLVPVLLMFAACAAFGAALDRVALGGTTRS
jgi:hypothetical protein